MRGLYVATWRVCVSMCVLDTTAIPAKTAEPIEMPFVNNISWRYIWALTGEYD